MEENEFTELKNEIVKICKEMNLSTGSNDKCFDIDCIPQVAEKLGKQFSYGGFVFYVIPREPYPGESGETSNLFIRYRDDWINPHPCVGYKKLRHL